MNSKNNEYLEKINTLELDIKKLNKNISRINDLEKTIQPLFEHWKSSLDLDFGDFINTKDKIYILNLLNENQ